jgi:hypothetical protein
LLTFTSVLPSILPLSKPAICSALNSIFSFLVFRIKILNRCEM